MYFIIMCVKTFYGKDVPYGCIGTIFVGTNLTLLLVHIGCSLLDTCNFNMATARKTHKKTTMEVETKLNKIKEKLPVATITTIFIRHIVQAKLYYEFVIYGILPSFNFLSVRSCRSFLIFVK